MTDTPTAEPRDAAQDVIAMTAATLAHDLVAAMLNELRTIPDHWSRLAEDRQQQSIERLKERARTMVDKGLKLLAGSNFPAVPGTLDFVASKKGISVGLTIDKGAVARHALFDAQGQRVLIVIADAAQWCERLDEIKAKRDQYDLFDPAANYDPARDQPGYRRDQDPFVPAGPTWADMKKQLKGEGEPVPGLDLAKPGDDQTTGETPAEDTRPRCDIGVGCEKVAGHGGECGPLEAPESPPVAGDDPAPDGLLGADLVDKLVAVGVHVTLADIATWTGLQFNVALEWVEAYAEGLQTLNDRPDFLPVPNNEGKKK